MPSYLSSQYEIFSSEMASLHISTSFCTGMTCIPTPAPPGGTICVSPSSGIRLIRSKNLPISGCSSKTASFILANSALPGTNIGSTYCFSCFGFSQLYSITPLKAILLRSSSRYFSSIPVILTSSGSVFGLRTPIFNATSAISSVQIAASPQYSGSSAVSFSNPSFIAALSVTIFPSLRIGSLTGSSGCGFLNSTFLVFFAINHPPLFILSSGKCRILY